MGPIFSKKILKHGSIFKLSPNLWVFAWEKPETNIPVSLREKPKKSQHLWKMSLFFKKNPYNGYPFLPKWGRGFEAWGAHPHPKQIRVPQEKYPKQSGMDDSFWIGNFLCELQSAITMHVLFYFCSFFISLCHQYYDEMVRLVEELMDLPHERITCKVAIGHLYAFALNR